MMEYMEIIRPLAREFITWAVAIYLLYFALKLSLWVACTMSLMHGAHRSSQNAPPRGRNTSGAKVDKP